MEPSVRHVWAREVTTDVGKEAKCSPHSDPLADAGGFSQGEPEEAIGITYEPLPLWFNRHVDMYIFKTEVVIFFQLLTSSHILQLAEGHRRPSSLPTQHSGLTFFSTSIFDHSESANDLTSTSPLKCAPIPQIPHTYTLAPFQFLPGRPEPHPNLLSCFQSFLPCIYSSHHHQNERVI